MDSAKLASIIAAALPGAVQDGPADLLRITLDGETFWISVTGELPCSVSDSFSVPAQS